MFPYDISESATSKYHSRNTQSAKVLTQAASTQEPRDCLDRVPLRCGDDVGSRDRTSVPMPE